MRIRDPGWRQFGSGIRDKHPGSATLGSMVSHFQLPPYEYHWATRQARNIAISANSLGTCFISKEQLCGQYETSLRNYPVQNRVERGRLPTCDKTNPVHIFCSWGPISLYTSYPLWPPTCSSNRVTGISYRSSSLKPILCSFRDGVCLKNVKSYALPLATLLELVRQYLN